VNRFFQEGARQDPIHPLVTSPPCPLTAEALPAPAVQTKRRAPRPEKPWRIAHLFHTLIDQAHAPTKLLKLLLEHCDRQAFEPYVYVSEGSLIRPKEYPLHAFTAERSQSWGHDTCEFLAEHAITLRDMGDPSQSYTEQAAAIQAQLEEDEIDLLIAHIPNAVSKLLMQHSCVPRWVYFDHAGPFLKPEQAQRQRPHYFQLPTEDEYDALVLCEPKDAEIQRFYAERSIAIHSLPYAISARPRVPALERATLDIASSAKVFTTLSLFLQERLSPPCTEAIVEILKRCSDSHYLLIGPCGPKPPFMERFEAAGVAERVHCVGMQEEPGPFLGMADIYLNEFPEGSGLALIEAMGYGLPLVSLDDPSGPPQRRFASLYYGAEYSVNTVEGYIERACQLAQEPKTYAAARSAALEAYAQHSNAGRYVKDFEAVLLKQLSTPH
jgi:glycosyltransferase involved in cell wall biosynthesis